MEGAITITVTQAHCDELGHLNHVEAVRYLERARSQWYRACGLFDTESGQSLGTVVVNIDYNYRVECFVGERLKVTTRPIAMGTRSFTPGACDHQARRAYRHRRAVHQRHHGPRGTFDHPRAGMPGGTFAETRMSLDGSSRPWDPASSRPLNRPSTPDAGYPRHDGRARRYGPVVRKYRGANEPSTRTGET